MTGTGPFTFDTRRDFLSRVLRAQQLSGITLIEGDELAAIQEIWTREDQTPGIGATVRAIWSDVFKENDMAGQIATKPAKDQAEVEDELLRGVCEEQNVPYDLLLKLRDAEERFRHLKRRHGLPHEMRELVREAVRRK